MGREVSDDASEAHLRGNRGLPRRALRRARPLVLAAAGALLAGGGVPGAVDGSSPALLPTAAPALPPVPRSPGQATFPQQQRGSSATSRVIVGASALATPIPDAFLPGGTRLTLPPGSSAADGLLRASRLLDLPLARVPAALVPAADHIVLGRHLFHRDWTQPGGVDAGPVAGPDFDRASCSACHLEALPTAEAAAQRSPYLVARLLDPRDQARLGAQANTRRAGTGSPQAVVEIDYHDRTFRYPDGRTRTLRSPVVDARDSDGRPLTVGLRSAPLLFGWGLLEHVDLSMLPPFDDPYDRNGDGISGRLARVHDACTGEKVPGLFGWKASQPTLRAQISAALANDMGIEAAHVCPSREPAGTTARLPPELTSEQLTAMTAFVRHLAVPDHRRGSDAASVERGEHLFGRIGCGDCHVPVLLTRVDGPPALADQRLWPYTDLMLHDMGPALADPGNAPDAREWRTAPLWGVGEVERRLPHRGFLHDGRARDLEEAILWHGGEAARAQRRFVHLPVAEREAVLAFVRAL